MGIGRVAYRAFRRLPPGLHPSYRHAAIGAITNVELPSAHHLYWPEFDIDVAVGQSNIRKSTRW
jgi:hypothetical protein